ncbi:Crp/Fnr family transcriptional regulator [Tardiphaga sp.]|jgi:CRP-like cAMP-binding protein|uniref:Crp/Fnr family transcriptional regulator n=1 Tax=Tardiphaga sp. TaxID=1926292 RepID=UPI0037DA78B2
MPQHPNALLANLSQATFQKIEPLLKVVELQKGQGLADPGDELFRGYFPHSGILSFVVELPGGGAAETCIVGRDGVFGGLQALNHGRVLNRVDVQVSGEASVVPLTDLTRLLLENDEFRKAIISYELFAFAQAQQHVACNSHHTVQQRLGKWLLRMHDLVGPEIPLTQEFIAIMIGVRRTSVSDAAKEAHKLGIIDYSRGKIRILSKEKLESYSCECVDHIRGYYKQAFGAEDET